ncbi:hypothetical protein ANCCEY_00502 [Ancylostoma ceylanicum]|uniref:Uncharacterized protein n=1 Tax=Ancylostoma ceylanicum TaxID=53326 RepID=A0A0D6M8H4_9BILA|nr:hypothetical protein ANCCEY_00502 [Ancylostoma ceylanicum]
MAPSDTYTQRVGGNDAPSRERKTEDSDKKTPWRSVYVAALCSFVQSLQYGLFFSSLWPYLKSLLAVMFVSPSFGKTSSYHARQKRHNKANTEP